MILKAEEKSMQRIRTNEPAFSRCTAQKSECALSRCTVQKSECCVFGASVVLVQTGMGLNWASCVS